MFPPLLSFSFPLLTGPNCYPALLHVQLTLLFRDPRSWRAKKPNVLLLHIIWDSHRGTCRKVIFKKRSGIFRWVLIGDTVCLNDVTLCCSFLLPSSTEFDIPMNEENNNRNKNENQNFVNLCHRRWTEVTVFTPVCLFVCLFVNSITEKLLDGFRRNLVGRLGLVQGSCH